MAVTASVPVTAVASDGCGLFVHAVPERRRNSANDDV